MTDHGNGKEKAHLTLSRREASDYLRRLATRMEKGGVMIRGCEAGLLDKIHVTETAKISPGGRRLKITLKLDIVEPEEKRLEKNPDPKTAAAPPDSSLRPMAQPPEALKGSIVRSADLTAQPYKSAKKGMAAAFTELGRRFKNNRMPEEELVRGFEDNCRAMLAQPGKGDENYTVFGQAVKKLTRAIASGDLARASELHGELKVMKSRCHRKYK